MYFGTLHGAYLLHELRPQDDLQPTATPIYAKAEKVGEGFQKIGNYLNRPEYKFQSRHTRSGVQYWVKMRG